MVKGREEQKDKGKEKKGREGEKLNMRERKTQIRSDKYTDRGKQTETGNEGSEEDNSQSTRVQTENGRAEPSSRSRNPGFSLSDARAKAAKRRARQPRFCGAAASSRSPLQRAILTVFAMHGLGSVLGVVWIMQYVVQSWIYSRDSFILAFDCFWSILFDILRWI